jgi:O-methyltransferase
MDPEIRCGVGPNERFNWLTRRYAYPHLLTYRAQAQQAGLVSMLDEARMHQLLTMLLYSLTLPGDTIECGVYMGGTSAFMAHAASKARKTHFACDSLSGLPDETEHDNVHKRGNFADASLAEFRQGISTLGLEQAVDIRQGWFSETLPALADKRFCFAHIDADLFESTMECLEFVYPRMSTGGWIVLDDYTWAHCEGVSEAVNLFFANKPETVVEMAGNAAAVQRLS